MNIRQGKFGAKNITWDKEVHFIMIKGWIQQEDTLILYFYAPNKST